jgi:hypothetical protein
VELSRDDSIFRVKESLEIVVPEFFRAICRPIGEDDHERFVGSLVAIDGLSVQE